MARKVTLEQTFELALRYDQASDLQRAEAIYRKIIEKCPEHYNSQVNLADIYDRQGDEYDPLAIDCYISAYSYNPDMFYARYRYGSIVKKWVDKGFDQSSTLTSNSEAMIISYQYAIRSFQQTVRNAKKIFGSSPDKTYCESFLSTQQQLLIQKSGSIWEKLNKCQWLNDEPSNVNVACMLEDIQQIKSEYLWEDIETWNRIIDMVPYHLGFDSRPKDILIIGNKPFQHPDLSILDSFTNILRCNMALPFRNNGTRFGRLALCSHLYTNLIVKRISKSEFYAEYPTYDKKEIDYFYDNFDPSNYEMVFHAKLLSSRISLYNKFLGKLNCPYRFNKLPRTGYVVLFENLLVGNRVFIVNFSIHNEARDSYYVKEGQGDNSLLHSAEDELAVLRWLHQNEYVDATLCLLADDNKITLECKGLKATKFIVNKLELARNK